MDDLTSGHNNSSNNSNTDYAARPESPAADDQSLFPPASVLLLSFHRGGAFDGVNLTPATPQEELLLLTAALASHHRSLSAARERLRDSALLERERLDAALLMDLKQRELAAVIARIDAWVGQVPLPEQDGAVVDEALPLGFSFGDLFSVMAEVEISLDPTFRHEPERRRLAGQEFRFEELCWAYQGAVADLLEGRRYPPTARRRNEMVGGAGTPAGVPALKGEGAKGPGGRRCRISAGQQ